MGVVVSADQVNDQPPSGYVPVPRAARMLSLSQDALRKRIQRGTVAAEKVGGRWYVLVLPGQTVLPETGQQDAETGQRDTEAGQDATERDTVSGQQDVSVAFLLRYVDRLEQELDQRNAELRALHLQNERLTRALPAPDLGNEQAHGSAVRSWMDRLLRRDAR